MSFQLSILSLRRIENNIYARKGERKIIKRTKAGDHCLKSILHWFGIDLELLSAYMLGSRVMPSLQSFSDARKRDFVDDTRRIKIYRWSNDHACFATIKSCLDIPGMSLSRVSKHRPVSP